MDQSLIFTHDQLMERCLHLARKGLGNTFSNPLVGSVVTYNDRIIGEGYHQKFGENHAEVNAIRSVKDKDLLRKSTLYVNLEPCSHSGKTPPCTDLILRSGIPRIVIGAIDTSSKSAGKGIEKLKKEGCKVEVGILEEKSRLLNKRFFTFHEKKRPYIILKWAQSSDGFIDISRDKNDKTGPNWITGPNERGLVHKWRSEEQSILVGTNTVEVDDPALDVRNWVGTSPIRLIIDRTLRLKPEHKVFKDPSRVILFTAQLGNTTGVGTKVIDFNVSIWPQIMKYLFDQEIISVFVEGGAKTLNSLIKSDLWDEARVFTGEQEFTNGIVAPRLESEYNQQFRTWQSDLKIYYK